MTWTRYLIAGLIGGIAAWTLGLATSTTPPSTAAGQPDERTRDALLNELQELRAAISRLAAAPPAHRPEADELGSAHGPERREVSAETEDPATDPVVAALDAIRQTLREEFAALQGSITNSGKGGPGGMRTMLRARQNDGGDAVRQLCIRAGQGEEVATRELLFLTPREVLLRFGNPTHVGSGGDYWGWDLTGPDGTEYNLWTRFGSGYVTLAGAELND